MSVVSRTFLRNRQAKELFKYWQKEIDCDKVQTFGLTRIEWRAVDLFPVVLGRASCKLTAEESAHCSV